MHHLLNFQLFLGRLFDELPQCRLKVSYFLLLLHILLERDVLSLESTLLLFHSTPLLQLPLNLLPDLLVLNLLPSVSLQ